MALTPSRQDKAVALKKLRKNSVNDTKKPKKNPVSQLKYSPMEPIKNNPQIDPKLNDMLLFLLASNNLLTLREQVLLSQRILLLNIDA